MDSRAAIRSSYNCADMICQGYLNDLTDADLMVRPVPGSNHIAWQLGHLIVSDSEMVNAVCPGAIPALPDGFAAKFTKDTAGSDNPSDFYPKDKYLELFSVLRKGTLEALSKQSDEDLDQPAPESMRSYAPTVGDMFALIGIHWVMHGGQWAVTRRKLGRPPLF